MRTSNVDETSSHCSPDPWEVFTQLAILIVEGRTPGGEKGYHSGPHCPLPNQAVGNRHICDPNSPMCSKVESLLRQLRLMWGVGVGVSVEVLVAPECEHGAAFTITTLDATTAPSPLLRLIEQWNFTIYDRNVPEATSSGWSLVAAVRSFLHFSQLSAWLSVSEGSRPSNIIYRLTVTSPVFGSKFESDFEEHTFPVANLAQDTAIKVLVRSVPRSSKVPVVTCTEPHNESTASATASSSPSEPFSSPVSSAVFEPSPPTQSDFSSGADAGCRTEEDLRRSMMKAKLGEPCRASRSESPDLQLGDSLLDPPHSLSRIPRRFQSPSRSGSPSLETPEHIICRVRPPGPISGRLSEAADLYHPVVIPAQPSLNPFSWTQGKYPSAHFSPLPPRPDIFPPSPSLHPDRHFNQGGAPYTSLVPSGGPEQFCPSQLYWAKHPCAASIFPPEPSQLFHVFQSSEPHSHIQWFHSAQPTVNQHPPYIPSGVESCKYDDAANPTRFTDPDVAPPKPTSPEPAIGITPSGSGDQSKVAAFCPVSTASSEETVIPRIRMNSRCINIEVPRENHGMKRKGAYAKESPRTKRESPPHIFYMRESKDDKKGSEIAGECEDLLKRKNEGDEESFSRKNLPRRTELVTDQLWPRCSQPGKHLCSNIEDLGDVSNEQKQQPTFPCHSKSFKKEGKTTSSSKAEEPSLKFPFDLTAKETQEILTVLRQKTPVPPLRINQHRKSSDAECGGNVSDHVEVERDPKGIKIRRSSRDLLDSAVMKINALNATQPSDLKAFWCHTGNVESGIERDAENSPISSKKLRDTSFRKPSNCTCNKNEGKPQIDPNNEEDDTIEDGLSSVELEKLRTSSVDKPASETCPEAKTVARKMSFSRANNRSGSNVLVKSPLSSLLSSVKDITLQPNQKDFVGKARRVLNFIDEELHGERTSLEPLPSAHLSAKSSSLIKNNAGESTMIKEILKKNLLSAHENIPSADKTPKFESEMEIKILDEDISNGYIEKDEEEEEELGEEEEEDQTSGIGVGGVVDKEVEDLCCVRGGVIIPSASEKVKFRRSLDSAATLVFHNKTGLPLTSSPAPLRKGTCFDFDSSLNCVAAIKSAFRTCEAVDEEIDNAKDGINGPHPIRSFLSASAPATVTCSNLLGSFEECVLNGRLEPVSTVHGFSAEIAASGAFCPKHISKPVTAFFYTLCDNDQISSPYMGHINLGKKGYHIPNQGTVQVTLFNPHGTVVKMFVVVYDLLDMPPNSKTFLRQRTLNMPVGASDTHPDAHQWLRYLIHLRFASSKSGKIYLHTDIRMLICRKSDADAATLHKNNIPYELRSFTHGPINPKFSPRK